MVLSYLFNLGKLLKYFTMEEISIRGRSVTRSMSLAVDGPLPDVCSIVNEFSQCNLDSQSARVFAELKKVSDFQRETIQETVEKAQAMISDLIWQRDQQINRIKEECSTKAIELKQMILSFQNIDTTRRASRILKPSFNQPLLEFHREIAYTKHNWLQKNTIYIQFTENGLEKVQGIKSISQQISSMYEEISNAASTTQLILSRKLGDDGARHLAHILPYYTNLSILTLTSNFFGPRGGKFIATGLHQLKKLYKLSISNDKMKESVVSIMRVLPSLRNLEEVYLSTGFFCEREAADIGNALSIMNKLKNFSLLGGVLETRGTERLCAGLIFLTQLKTLDLSGNSLGAGGAELICLTLQNLVQLECLKLSANNFGSQAGVHLAGLLGHLRRLEELWINSNALGDQGICDLLKGECDLTCLNLQDNGIGIHGAIAVMEKCREWRNLRVVDLSWNSIDDSIAKYFATNKEELQRLTLNMCGMNLNEGLLNSFGFSVCV